jgi:hypothetical protein
LAAQEAPVLIKINAARGTLISGKGIGEAMSCNSPSRLFVTAKRKLVRRIDSISGVNFLTLAAGLSRAIRAFFLMVAAVPEIPLTHLI